jgi:hypothetical protein
MNARTALSRLGYIRSLVLAVALLGTPYMSSAAVFVSVNIAPPALPVYVQPVPPGPGYFWTPGYWAWGPEGYYWVPGTWVLAPFIGALWTPGYWGWGGAAYIWHPGYWGRHVGFYGGVNYGFGYTGVGYYGGYWNRGEFFYNTRVNNVSVVNIRNTYNREVVQNANASRVSYNGGAGGIGTQPTAEERIAEHETHRDATPMQLKHERFASTNRAQLASVNHGSPTLTSTARAGAFRSANAGAGNASGAGTHPNRELRAERGNPNGGGQHGPGTPQGHPQNMARPEGHPHEGGHGGGQHHEEGHAR